MNASPGPSGLRPPAPLPMPDLHGSFPGPFATSPHAEAIERQTTHWLHDFPLISSPSELKALCDITAQGVARVLPAADRDGVFLCADLFLWLTAFDDARGESEGARDTARLVRHISQCVHLLAGHEEPAGEAGVYTAALRDLLRRFRERATPTQYLRLTAHLRDNLFGILWEAHHLDRPDRVTLGDYRAMRPHTVFVRTVMVTAEVVLGYVLTEEQRDSAAVRDLEKAVADLAGWVNDLASYGKETDHGGPPPLSLPTLLSRHHECDLEEAFRLASRMCEERASTARLRITELTGLTGLTELTGLAVDGRNPPADHARAMEAVVASYIWHTGHARYER